jgi:Rrf2 family protein
MKLSTKGRYGTRAILEIAKEHGVRPVKRKDIVSAQRVPDSYIENILVSLKAAGIVQTIRGAHGGYQLTRSPELITILDVVEALEGSLVPVNCLEDDHPGCAMESGCPTREVWMEMYQAMRNVLRKYTLKDLLERQRGAMPLEYSI